MAINGSSSSALIDLRRQAVALFRAGVAAAEPGSAVATALEGRRAALDEARRVVLIAFGKAACPMIAAALPFVRDKLTSAIAVTNAGNAVEIDGVELIVGGHPLPDEGSLAGAAAIERAAGRAEAGDLVLVLVSGGGSALVCAPPDGVTLADKIALNDALIRSGADIRAVNAVRQHVSRLKGGGLARLARPARVLSLIVSDVPDDDVRIVASGPTAPAAATAAEAAEIMDRHGIGRRFRDMLCWRGAGEADALDHVENVVIGSNRISVDEIAASAARQGVRVVRAHDWLCGDVRDAARSLHRIARENAGRPGPVAVVTGGEPTVAVTGSGMGGRNQELALRFALAAEEAAIRRDWVFLSGGTDGRDGPTDAAGGIVDAGSTAWMRSCGQEPAVLLGNNDSYAALALSGDLLMTGATGTNVADLQILLIR